MNNSIDSIGIRDLVIRHPRMFIGRDWNQDGLHFLVMAITRLTVDPITSNNATQVSITQTETGDIVIADDGRGLPAIPNSRSKQAPIESVVTGYAVTRPDIGYYGEFGFLDHLGAVLGAVSERLVIETTWDGTRYRLVCSRNELVEPMHAVSDATDKGTTITFTPDPEIFAGVGLDGDKLAQQIAALAEEYPQVQFRQAVGENPK